MCTCENSDIKTVWFGLCKYTYCAKCFATVPETAKDLADI